MTKNSNDTEHTNTAIDIRAFNRNDIDGIVFAFAKHHWPKPVATFETYHQEQEQRERQVWLAFYQEQFAGYITLKQHSLYKPFLSQMIPEIMDLNVLPPFRNKGIGRSLLAIAEKEAALMHDVVGIGVGLYRDYGAAQKLYIKKGYIPDGQGITYNYQPIAPGSTVCLDDDLILWFTKKLRKGAVHE